MIPAFTKLNRPSIFWRDGFTKEWIKTLRDLEYKGDKLQEKLKRAIPEIS